LSCPADLGAGDQRQGLLGEIVVAGGVGVGEVDAAPLDVDHDLGQFRARVGDLV
jgi:hypothetical protein